MNLKNNQNKKTQKNLRLCFVGNMLGQNDGYITTQGQIVAELFTAENYDVTCVSSKINRMMRMTEITYTLIKNHRKFDVVILEVYSGLNLIMAELVGLLCKFFKLPLIMVLHGGELPKFAEQNPRRMKRILNRADILTAPSHFLAEKIGILGFEIKVIPNVLKIDLYPFNERRKIKPNLFWMRSFHPVYNPQMAIEVLAKLKKTYPDATLTMAGVDKGLEEEIKKMTADLGLKNAVRFPGFLCVAEKKEEFSRADIFINTNRIDNMPVAVVEACAFGLPVVATEVGGLPYLLTNRENGVLVPNEDAETMTQEIKNLIENSEFARKLSNGGRRLAEKSAWENVRSQWEKLFAELAGKKSFEATESLIKEKVYNQ